MFFFLTKIKNMKKQNRFQKLLIIGAGISGLTVAQNLREKFDVMIFEKESVPGGLIRCRRVDGSLFHICGGHVFNSKRQDVLDWFWKHFDKEKEFTKADRNSVVFMSDGNAIPYPIENHAYLFTPTMMRDFVKDLVTLAQQKNHVPANFEDFLKGCFGNTLYREYFQPYNEKVWRRDLKKVPLSWLEGKLPMPTVEEMIFNNINHVKEKEFVHSTFWYEKQGGSQFIANRLAEGLNIRYNTPVEKIEKRGNEFVVNGEVFDKIVFCGNVKQLQTLYKSSVIEKYKSQIEALESHGTTAVFCEIEKNPYSWIYMPSREHQSHRIICTGNFSPTNNAPAKMTASIEFTDEISKEEILKNLEKIPLKPKYLTHHYNQFTYPIQDSNTREIIREMKSQLSAKNFFMTGRFADWEYYNMDVAIGAAIDLCKTI